ncbi:hypothetical protein ANRL1_02402 [Anaerolineae bacterium]|nr:hypothetical protein ANRL1_02402 [Anaerolineae bacterium]
MLVVVHSASTQDAAGGKDVLQNLFDQIKYSVHNSWCRLKLVWADGGYTNIVEWVKKSLGWKLEIKKRPQDVKGFVPLPQTTLMLAVYNHDIVRYSVLTTAYAL